MMRTSLIAVALSALSFVAAEMKNFTINPSEVPLSQRASWCQAEINTCGTLCVQTPTNNVCNPDDLSYNCTCQNGTAPGLQYYTETMYSFTCQQAFQDCITANVGNATGQEGCTDNIEDYCGKLNPNNFTAPQSSSSSSSSSAAKTSSGAAKTGSASASPTGTGTAAVTTSAKGAAATMAYLGNGAAVVAAGVFAAML